MYRERLGPAIMGGSATSLRERYKNVVRIVANVNTSRDDEISSAFVTTIRSDRDGLVGSTLVGSRDKFIMFSLSFELYQRRICEENASLAVDVNGYKVRVINMEKKLDEKEPNKMALL